MMIQPAAAQEPSESGNDRILDVAQIDGPIDAPTRDFVLGVLSRAQENKHIVAIVLRIDTPGTLGEDGFALARAVRNSRVPVIAWVGREAGTPVASGAGLLLVAASHLVGVSPKAELGPTSPEDLKTNRPISRAAAREQFALLVSPGKAGDTAEDGFATLTHRKVKAQEALTLGVADFEAAFFGAVLTGAHGRSVHLANGEVVTLDLAENKNVSGRDERHSGLVPTVTTRFQKPAGIAGLLHKINTPTFAYVLLIIGLAAIVFEYFASSIGIAGVIGGVCVLAAFQAIGVLPVNWWAVVAIAIGIVLMAADVAMAGLGIFTIAGAVSVACGSIFFTYTSDYRVRWWVIVLMLVGLIMFFAYAMTAMVMARFSATS